MGPAEQYIRDECQKVLQEVELHLEAYPMGEKYFGKVAAQNPMVLSVLRAGKLVNPQTLDKLRHFMNVRSGEKSTEFGVACPVEAEGEE